ncbi:MAG: hypothetical protein ABSE73_16065 [Planctomycetota bacterium]
MGWGGGGFYWACAFHPAKDGVIYLGGDVNGVYKTEDRGAHWRICNTGLTDYAIYSLAVDAKHPDTVYAGTPSGVCKSTDAGEHWQFSAKTGPKDLRITAERGLSVRAIAVDPSDGNIVYAGSPGGKVYKSTDGALTWKQVYQVPVPAAAEGAAPPNALRAQFGGVNAAYHGGFWLPLAWPVGTAPKDCQGFGFTFKGNGAAPKTAILTLRTPDGAVYGSKNLCALFQKTDWQDVWLTEDDFTLEAAEAGKQTEKSAAWPKKPDWGKCARVDFCCVNMDNEKPSLALFGMFYSAPSGSADKAARIAGRDFAKDKECHPYGNMNTAAPQPPKAGTVFSVIVSAKHPALVLAATEKAGLVKSEDGGATWTALPTPQHVSHAALAPSDEQIIYAACGKEGVWKSSNGGQTWNAAQAGMDAKCAVLEAVVDPQTPDTVYAIGNGGWNGSFFRSTDGAKTWACVRAIATDVKANPTLPDEYPGNGKGSFSTLTNLALNPANAKELFVSGNWRNCFSSDAGQTWEERDAGADITCVSDIRFLDGQTYVTAMDEGLLASADHGASWRQLCPLKYANNLSGHQWRVSVSKKADGAVKIVSTSSPWAEQVNRVLVSEDSGKTFKPVQEGLPGTRPGSNCMWGEGYARALAADPKDPNVLYLGIDGDPEPAKKQPGGGVFKSVDGGLSWKAPAQQPGSRRMFFGLVVDPAEPRRVFWGACGNGGGLYRSEDGGETWAHVFKNETWLFNVAVSPAGVVYAPGANLWRSRDHGTTWEKITAFTDSISIVGLEIHPRDEQTIWLSRVNWGNGPEGGVYKTKDGGATWQEITGDIPHRKPLVLRYDAEAGELWAGGVGLYKLKQ